MTSHNQSYANDANPLDWMIETQDGDPLRALLALMERLRDPLRGCPWDKAQSFASIAPYTIEEAYEVMDAIQRGDMADLKAELGDLLFQVVFHAQIAREAGVFDFAEVAGALVAKMVRRHPHVFGDGALGAGESRAQTWESLKAQERAQKGAHSVLDDIPLALPALMRADKLTRRAARIGFDWPDTDAVLEKLEEEKQELAQARAEGDAAHVQEEYGDLLFVMANLGRKLGLDPEEALRQANAKFERRFRAIEAMAAAKGSAGQLPLAELEALWAAVKAAE